MILEWVKTLGPILISWPVVGLIAILVFHKPLRAWADRVQRLKVGSIEFERVKETVDQVEKRQALQEAEIGAIKIALKGMLSKHEIGILTRLGADEKVLMQYEPDLYQYLHRLDGLDLIQPKQGYGLYDIVRNHRKNEKLPPEQRPQFDLAQYVYITDDGKKYLNTLEDILDKGKRPGAVT
jgi:hypothetical protein